MNDLEIKAVIDDLAAKWGPISLLPDRIKSLEDDRTQLRSDIARLRRHHDSGLVMPRSRGTLSPASLSLLGAAFVMSAQKGGHFPLLERAGHITATRRDRLIADAGEIMQRWTGETTTELPLPSQYFGDFRELIADYGVARRSMTPWSLTGGTDKPPRQKTGFTFGLISMSANFTELNPAYEWCSLESHKFGGIIITPREIWEQSPVGIGQWLATLAAPRFAYIEDYVAFLADGTGTYDSIKGVTKICYDNSTVVTLGGGKTSPNDAEAGDFQDVLALVNARVRETGKWYMSNSWEAFLPSLNTEANQYVFRYRADGTPLLFGKEIVWTEVMQGWTTSAAAAKYIAVFGDLSWWYFAQRPSSPRIDTSTEVLFTYDQYATRCFEEIDVDYLATDAAAALKTATA